MTQNLVGEVRIVFKNNVNDSHISHINSVYFLSSPRTHYLLYSGKLCDHTKVEKINRNKIEISQLQPTSNITTKLISLLEIFYIENAVLLSIVFVLCISIFFLSTALTGGTWVKWQLCYFFLVWHIYFILTLYSIQMLTERNYVAPLRNDEIVRMLLTIIYRGYCMN